MTHKFHGKDHDKYLDTQVTKVLYVDGNRTDFYTANGSPTKPFKTINDAEAVAASDTTIVVSQGTYVEDVTVTNARNIVGLLKPTIQGNVTIAGAGYKRFRDLVIAGNLNLTASIDLVDVSIYGTTTVTGSGSVCITQGNLSPSSSGIKALVVNSTGACTISESIIAAIGDVLTICLLYTSPSPRDATLSRMPSSA